MIFLLSSCDKSMAKKLEGTYKGIYSEEILEAGTGFTDTTYTAEFHVTENKKHVTINDNWDVPVDGIRDEKIFETGEAYHKAIQFKGDSLKYTYSIIVDGNSAFYIFNGKKQ